MKRSDPGKQASKQTRRELNIIQLSTFLSLFVLEFFQLLSFSLSLSTSIHPLLSSSCFSVPAARELNERAETMIEKTNNNYE
jgi:hypothetical protein